MAWVILKVAGWPHTSLWSNLSYSQRDGISVVNTLNLYFILSSIISCYVFLVKKALTNQLFKTLLDNGQKCEIKITIFKKLYRFYNNSNRPELQWNLTIQLKNYKNFSSIRCALFKKENQRMPLINQKWYRKNLDLLPTGQLCGVYCIHYTLIL